MHELVAIDQHLYRLQNVTPTCSVNKYINKAPNLKFLRNENREAKFRSLKVASSRYSNFSNDMYNMTAKH